MDNPVKPEENSQPPVKKLSFLKDILNQKGHFVLVVGIVIVLLVIGGTSYFLINNKKAPASQNNQANQPSTNTTPVSTTIPNEPENIKAITGNARLSYLFDPHDSQKIILKQVDFKTNSTKGIILPYFTESNRDENKRGRHIVSPNGKYILRLTRNKLEIAELPNPNFRMVHTVKSITDPKWQNSGQNFDFAHMDDAMWDNDGKLYFITGVGLDGVGAPPGGAYTDLYVANEDGSNPRLVNDHTKENQNYGSMKHFAYIDTAKKEIYFSGDSHGGHYAHMIIVDATDGSLKQTLTELGRTIVVFNTNFSKAYFKIDQEEKGYDDVPQTKLYEYDMNSKSKKLLYAVTNVVQDYSNQIEGSVDINQAQNKLFFQVRDSKAVHYYVLDLATSGQPKLLFDDNGSCTRMGISDNGDFLLLVCNDRNAKVNEYQFYQVSTGKKSTFYKESYTDNSTVSDAAIQLISFK